MADTLMVNDSCSINRKWSALVQLKIFKLKILEFIIAVTLSIMMEVLPIRNPFCCLVAAPTVILTFIIMILYIIDQCSTELEIYFLIIELVLVMVAFVSFYIFTFFKVTIDYMFKLLLLDLFLLMFLDLFAVKSAKGCLM